MHRPSPGVERGKDEGDRAHGAQGAARGARLTELRGIHK